MTLKLFEGPAGSGKTTSLMAELEVQLASGVLQDGQKVLALSKMHGSRRRLQARLSASPLLRQRFHCVTLDSFAWHLLLRWRSLAHSLFGNLPGEGDYQAVCERAGRLMESAVVGNWVFSSFPIVLIDELQDSKGGQLKIVQELGNYCTCIAAADDFQDLEAALQNPAVTWARGVGTVVALNQIYRTDVAGLLSAAVALREGHPVPVKGPGFSILRSHGPNPCAGLMARYLTWWYSSGSIAIITPVRQSNAPFVKGTITRLGSAPFVVNGKSLGPFNVPWEASQEEDEADFLIALALPANPDAIVQLGDLVVPTGFTASAPLISWLDWQKKVGGNLELKCSQLKVTILNLLRHAKNFSRKTQKKIEALTIHQAKNREYDSVIVLWPYQVTGSDEAKRRLLYNAVTRARRQAVVLVQDPSKDQARLSSPPFR